MSYFAKKFSNGPKFTFNSDELPFISLDDFVKDNGNKQFVVKAVFVHSKGKKFYPAVVSSSYKIWLPNHMLKVVNAILDDPEAINLINAGKCAFLPRQYEKTDEYAGIYNTGDFIDNE